jgi:hypothetical protein
MTFDDQLRRALDTLTAKLHDETSRHAQIVIDELATAAQAERDQVVAAVQREHDAAMAERDQHDAEVERERHTAYAEVDRERQAAYADLERRAAEAELARQAAYAELERLAAEAELARQAAPSAEPVPPAADLSAVGARIVSGLRAIDDARTLSEILDTLVTWSAREAGRVAVVLVRGGGYTGWRSIGFDPPFSRGEPINLPPDAFTIPLAVGGETVAVLYSEFDLERADVDLGLVGAVLEIFAVHAARCLESVTAFKAARAALVKTGDRADERSDDSSADEDAAARRYAKLLVSEIKLYHEPEVLAGQRERDLATRLGGEIARARVLYEQRVPAPIREQTDYFHDELVRTLANGDSTLLQLT